MWEGGVGDSEFNKRLSQASNEEKFQISDSLKAALRLEVKQWVIKFMPQAKDDAIDSEAKILLGLAFYHFENAVNSTRELRFPPNLTGDNCP